MICVDRISNTDGYIPVVICDQCRGKIRNIDNGRLVWFVDAAGDVSYGTLSQVHKRCYWDFIRGRDRFAKWDHLSLLSDVLKISMTRQSSTIAEIFSKR